MGNRNTQHRINTLPRCLALCIAASIGGAMPLAGAHAQTPPAVADTVEFDIPAGGLSAAMDRFAEQSGLQIVSEQPLLRGLEVAALRGRYAPEDALKRLLRGSDIVYQRLNARTLVLKPSPAPARPEPQQSRPPAAPAQPREPKVQDLGNVIVTGSRIRGGSTPSPVITIGSENIREEGFADLGEVVRSISQNYSGGQNPGVTSGASQGGWYNQNITGGSAANLRGLGQDATLTLLNGRRMSYAGYDQAVDLSTIPIEAVDRVEIVADGASAIYGSDAVGGVVNVILSRDFDGVAIGARHGNATGGGLSANEYSAVAGTTWASGGLVATWKRAANSPIYATQRDYTKGGFEHTTLYQEGDLRSGLLSAHQSLGDSVELQLDVLRAKREMVRESQTSATSYFHYPVDTTTTLVSPSVVLTLPNTWTVGLHAALGNDETSYSLAQVTLGSDAASNTDFAYKNNGRIIEVDGEGPLFKTPGGEARLALGLGTRHNDFLYLYHSPVLTYGGAIADGEESSRFGYAELDLPLVGADQGVAGMHRLGLTGAIRTEDYDSYGRVTTPKLGAIWSPTASFTMKASWGKSFKAPTLYQRYILAFSYLYPASTFGEGFAPDATTLYLNGGNANLKPERARTWSASLAFHPETLPGLEAELTWFSVDYTDRIVQPITNSSQSLTNPNYANFVTHDPSAERQAEVLDETEFTNYTGRPYDASQMVAIIDNRFVNTSRQRTRGVDLSGAYRFDLGMGRLATRGSISWLDSKQALAPGAPYSRASGVLFYPARVFGRAGLVWSSGGLTASLFGNYRSGVEDTANRTRGTSFTTFDATARYDLGARNDHLADLAFEFTVQNLLDRAPPLYATTSLYNVPYDSTNYSAIGRYLSFAVSKRW